MKRVQITKKKGAPKGNQYAVGNKGGKGQEPVYNPKFVEMGKKAAQAGFTDVEIAKLFGVSHTTIYNWKKDHKDFALATLLGKEGPNNRVENSLYGNAVSYEYEEQQAVYNPKTQKVEVKTVRKFHHGETPAQRVWLNNRRPDRWRDQPVAMVPQDAFQQTFTLNIFERDLDPAHKKPKTIEGKFKRMEDKRSSEDDDPVMP